MAYNIDKLRRLARAAQLYYLEDKNQAEVAQALGVSRPLVSRLLREARELGVVEITVHPPQEPTTDPLQLNFEQAYGLRGSLLAPDGSDDSRTNELLSNRAIELIGQIRARRIGIGWGHFIGQLVNRLDHAPPPSSTVEHICPLLGNAGVPIRNYHSNENVRIMSQRLSAQPFFLYLPALAESFEEKQLLCSTELYRQAYRQWQRMDTALINISNYPSSPDFASVARYGDALQKQKACGRLLAYYFNEQGDIIHSDHDFAIQLPISLLAHCPNVVGLCSANTSLRALQGALNTRLFTHIVAREALVRELAPTFS